jgi:hypothetical protein
MTRRDPDPYPEEVRPIPIQRPSHTPDDDPTVYGPLPNAPTAATPHAAPNDPTVQSHHPSPNDPTAPSLDPRAADARVVSPREGPNDPGSAPHHPSADDPTVPSHDPRADDPRLGSQRRDPNDPPAVAHHPSADDPTVPSPDPRADDSRVVRQRSAANDPTGLVQRTDPNDPTVLSPLPGADESRVVVHGHRPNDPTVVTQRSGADDARPVTQRPGTNNPTELTYGAGTDDPKVVADDPTVVAQSARWNDPTVVGQRADSNDAMAAHRSGSSRPDDAAVAARPALGPDDPTVETVFPQSATRDVAAPHSAGPEVAPQSAGGDVGASGGVGDIPAQQSDGRDLAALRGAGPDLRAPQQVERDAAAPQVAVAAAGGVGAGGDMAAPQGEVRDAAAAQDARPEVVAADRLGRDGTAADGHPTVIADLDLPPEPQARAPQPHSANRRPAWESAPEGARAEEERAAQAPGVEAPGEVAWGAQAPGEVAWDAQAPGVEVPGEEPRSAQARGVETPGVEVLGAQAPGVEGAERQGAWEAAQGRQAGWQEYHARLAELTEIRVRHPERVAEAWQQRRTRALVGDDGRLLIVAADHPARGALGVRGDRMAMASRPELIARLMTALQRPGVDGVLATPDILEDLLLLGALEGKVVIGSMNRGGLQGAAFEVDDRFTAYRTADEIAARRLDGGKMLTRIDLGDPGTVTTLESSAAAVTGLAEHKLMAMVEPFWSTRAEDGRVTNLLDPDSVIKSIQIASALGATSAYTWLKLPVVDELDRVMEATTLPTLLLGGDPTVAPEATYASWGKALSLSSVRGLVVGRALLFPPDGDVAAAVDQAAALVHGAVT